MTMVDRPMVDSDRRAHTRHAVDVDVLVRLASEQFAGRLVDVGAGGAFLRSDRDLALGSDLTIVVPATGVSARAGVRRVENEGIGVQFDDATVGAIVTGWAKGVVN